MYSRSFYFFIVVALSLLSTHAHALVIQNHTDNNLTVTNMYTLSNRTTDDKSPPIIDLADSLLPQAAAIRVPASSTTMGTLPIVKNVIISATPIENEVTLDAISENVPMAIYNSDDFVITLKEEHGGYRAIATYKGMPYTAAASERKVAAADQKKTAEDKKIAAKKGHKSKKDATVWTSTHQDIFEAINNLDPERAIKLVQSAGRTFNLLARSPEENFTLLEFAEEKYPSSDNAHIEPTEDYEEEAWAILKLHLGPQH